MPASGPGTPFHPFTPDQPVDPEDPSPALSPGPPFPGQPLGSWGCAGGWDPGRPGAAVRGREGVKQGAGGGAGEGSGGKVRAGARGGGWCVYVGNQRERTSCARRRMHAGGGREEVAPEGGLEGGPGWERRGLHPPAPPPPGARPPALPGPSPRFSRSLRLSGGNESPRGPESDSWAGVSAGRGRARRPILPSLRPGPVHGKLAGAGRLCPGSQQSSLPALPGSGRY